MATLRDGPVIDVGFAGRRERVVGAGARAQRRLPGVERVSVEQRALVIITSVLPRKKQEPCVRKNQQRKEEPSVKKNPTRLL